MNETELMILEAAAAAQVECELAYMLGPEEMEENEEWELIEVEILLTH